MNPPVPNRSLDIEPGTRMFSPHDGEGTVKIVETDNGLVVWVQWDNGGMLPYNTKALNRMGVYPIDQQ